MPAASETNGVIYCRVSTKDQVDGTSLESQERICREWAERQGVTIIQVFIDKGESAKTADRTEFIKAISFCSQRKNVVRYFIVYKLDRFARSQDDHVSVRATLKRYGVELRSATEPINETPVGRAMEGMISVFAEFDNNIRRERCMGGMMERVRHGFWCFRAPLGYYRPAPGANIAPDPEHAPWIRRIFVEYAKGTHTYEALAALMATRGMRTREGKRPSAQLMHKTLTNPAYAGIIEAWSERHEGKFEALVPQDLFERCQPGRRRIVATSGSNLRCRDNPAFPLRRTVCNECGRRLTGSFSRSGSGRHKRYPYYHHQRQGCHLARFVPKESFERTFLKYLGAITLNGRFEKLLAALVQATWKQTTAARDSERVRIEREIGSVTQERQQIFDHHRAGTYTVDEFLEQKALLSDRLAALQRRLADLSVSDFPADQAVRYCFEFGRETVGTWQRLDPASRAQFQQLVFVNGEIRFDGDGFWNSPLTAIYALNRDVATGKSTKVDLRGQFWNHGIRDELKKWVTFGQALSRQHELDQTAA
jgi:site-specific DNA recombinase